MNCIACGSELKAKIYVAKYCIECRKALGEITKSVRRHLIAARVPHASDYPCVDCGKPAREYDHRYYGQPLEIEPVCVLCNQRRGPAHDAVDLIRDARGLVSPETPSGKTLDEIVSTEERKTISEALMRCKGNRTAAARFLQVSYRSLRYRIAKLGL